MAARSMLDPFGLWAELAAKVEKVGNQAAQSCMKSAEFQRADEQGAGRQHDRPQSPARGDAALLGDDESAVARRHQGAGRTAAVAARPAGRRVCGAAAAQSQRWR